MIHTNHEIRIAGTGSYTPLAVLENKDFSHVSNDGWIKENLGIHRRRFASKEEYSSNLSFQAACNALRDAGINRNDIDLIIVATSTPDRKAPSTACLLQDLLKVDNKCPAFDIQAVCSGFLYALTVGSQMLAQSTAENALIVGVDTFSKITDFRHRDAVFFGDGAGAVVIQKKKGFFSSHLYANGKGKNNFTVFPGHETFTMNGKAVYETGTTVLPAAIESILAHNNLSVSDISHIIPHQPSIRVLKKTAEILNIPFSKIHTNMQDYANTAGATIPLLLDQIKRSGKFNANDLIVFAAVGSGWAWGAALYRW